ncbi:serine hydrolase domain-containing protein [Actinomadura montaniterrae]|uniref:Beta-lactamase family protein n=1 Tax=Actinomadura montaniterrae TaxID=1803903 RepID=A0A6L3VSB4_9ACTN|nr:serine hydrolase domain-containing protein [Actinomadura montaniterrae]KAB2378932.1 beta-lactamase family protein [Actinomadura montaniterrae]
MLFADHRPDSVKGRFAPGMAPVVEAFASSIGDPAAGGAALSIWHDGEEVVDVHAGIADTRTGRPWDAATRAVLFSATKGLGAVAVARLADELKLDLDAPVASVWPEFAAHGKERITITDVLAHRAGLVAPDTTMSPDDLADVRGFADRLAAQRPMWPDACSHLYHALTWGPLVSEIVRRATSREAPDVFAREIAAPLDAAVTLRADDRDLRHLAYTTAAPETELLTSQTIPQMGELAHRMLTAGGALPLTLVGDGTGLNDPRLLKAGLLSAAGVGTASGLARIWSATITPTRGVRILSDDAVRRLAVPRSTGPNATDTETDGPFHRWGAGVQLSSEALTWLSPSSFGHDGAGGQAGFADPDYGIGFGYVTNRMAAAPLIGPIVKALRSILDHAS